MLQSAQVVGTTFLLYWLQDEVIPHGFLFFGMDFISSAASGGGGGGDGSGSSDGSSSATAAGNEAQAALALAGAENGIFF